MTYQPRYYVAMMTTQEAERYTRRIYNIPPEHGIGWTPYRFYILTDGHTSHKAFVERRDFKRWLDGRKVEITNLGKCLRGGWVASRTRGGNAQ